MSWGLCETGYFIIFATDNKNDTMNGKLFFMTACLSCCSFQQLSAQSRPGGITPQMLQEIRQSVTPSLMRTALSNAVAANAIDKLAENHSNAGDIDASFTFETPIQSITDQKSSGRCWMFSGLNVVRANYKLRTGRDVELSHVYLFFWDQMEKANLCLQGIIDTAKESMNHERVRFFFKDPIGDGGTFCGVADLTEKYGLVPKNIMPETFSSDNTAKMKSLISSKLREDGLVLRKMVAEGKKGKLLEQEKTRMLSEIYGMLSLTLGTPPRDFEFSLTGDKDNKRTFTPQSFCQVILEKPLNGSFIMVMNDPRHDYYKTYEVEYDRHTYDGHNWVYLNLPMDDIEALAIASIRSNHKLYSSYDVGKFLDRSRGYCDTENYDYGALFGTTFGMDKAQRISTFDSGSTHAMTLTAVELDSEGKAVKWKVENSWGASYGYQGCLIMTDRWFREYMFRLVVDKEFVHEKLLKMCEQKPVMLMPEDPLFLPDE